MAISSRILLIGAKIGKRAAVGNSLAVKMDSLNTIVRLIHANLNAGNEYSVCVATGVGIGSAHGSRARAVTTAEVLGQCAVGARLVHVFPADTDKAGIVGPFPREHAHQRPARAIRIPERELGSWITGKPSWRRVSGQLHGSDGLAETRYRKTDRDERHDARDETFGRSNNIRFSLVALYWLVPIGLHG